MCSLTFLWWPHVCAECSLSELQMSLSKRLLRWRDQVLWRWVIYHLKTNKARRGGVEVAGWTLDRKIRVRFPAYPHRVWTLWWQGGKRRLRTSRCPCRGTGHLAVIGHQQLSDAVELYGVFLHTLELRQFRWGKGHRSKSQNTKKWTSRRSRNWHAYLKQRQ